MPPNNQNPYGPPPAPEHPQSEEPDYGFIMEPPKPARRGLSLPGFFGPDSSLLARVALVLGGLLALIIIFAIARSLFSGGGNTAALTSVAQSQQSIIHVITNGPGQDNQQQATLADSTKNFSATAQATLTSAQAQLIQYMADNHKKINEKDLDLKIDPAIDAQLSTAAANSTYDSAFRQAMKTQLTSYEQALQEAYKQTTGPKGRALLSQEFDDAQLLLRQLDGS